MFCYITRKILDILVLFQTLYQFMIFHELWHHLISNSLLILLWSVFAARLQLRFAYMFSVLWQSSLFSALLTIVTIIFFVTIIFICDNYLYLPTIVTIIFICLKLWQLYLFVTIIFICCRLWQLSLFAYNYENYLYCLQLWQLSLFVTIIFICLQLWQLSLFVRIIFICDNYI